MSDKGITNPALGEDLQKFSGIEFFQKFFPSLVGIILSIGVIIFFFMMLLGAIQLIFSGGDKGAVEAAKGRLTFAIIGLVILFVTFAVIGVIEAFFKINILTLDIGPLRIE